jgi:hypothetical protein
MFRRLINNNVKTIGIKRLSNESNNHRIVQELEQIKNALQAIAISLCGLNFIVGFKR